MRRKGEEILAQSSSIAVKNGLVFGHKQQLHVQESCCITEYNFIDFVSGHMMVGRDKALTTNREVGHLSCYLIAHQKGFNAYAVKNRQTFIDEGRKRKRRESI